MSEPEVERAEGPVVGGIDGARDTLVDGSTTGSSTSSIVDLFESAAAGRRASLARLLSWVERGGPRARRIGELAYPLGGGAYTIGMTGAPGAGKSTLTDCLISQARTEGQVAVVAVDPSSPFSGGAILGDRVRMADHATDQGVYIRSMATRGHLGGLSLAVPEAIRLLDAVGFPVVLVETVGVGQVEVEVAGAADTTVVVVTPGWGDSVQANKAGLMEIADIFVINKADRPGVRQTERDLKSMLDLSLMGDWRPPIVRTVASDDEGPAELWAEIVRHRLYNNESGALELRRAKRLEDELRRIVIRLLEQRALGVWDGPAFESRRLEMMARRLDPYRAAGQIVRSVAEGAGQDGGGAM